MTKDDSAPDRLTIAPALVRRLVEGQFPDWAGLPVRPVEPGGWDHRTFRFGEDLAVRLPSAARYAGQVEKEHLWLPRLAPHLPLPVPEPLAIGEPGEGVPWRWSVRRWLPGETATAGGVGDRHRLAVDLARFLVALETVDPDGGPPPGPHNFFRGGPLDTYDAETREAIRLLEGEVDAAGATAIWEAALGATWRGPAVWVHGDVHASNLLVDDGILCGVIDFGGLGIGDPACDLAIAWTLLDGESREAFREGLSVDDGTWARGRGWALWKALITLAGAADIDAAGAGEGRQVIDRLLAEHADGDSGPAGDRRQGDS